MNTILLSATLPPPPRFPLCQDLAINETVEFTVILPDDRATVDVSAKMLQLRALNVEDRDLNVSLVDPGMHVFYKGLHRVLFSATDKYKRTVYCNATVTVKGELSLLCHH